jgi:hypothetical protein
MALWNSLLVVWGWFVTIFNNLARKNISKSMSERLCDSDLEKLQREINNLGVYDLHDVLRWRKRLEWCEWHLSINENHKAIEIAKNFHQDFKKLKSSSSIAREIDTIEEGFLKFMPADDKWNKIRKDLNDARKENNPKLVIRAYTVDQRFTERLNKHCAVNTYHALRLYCTLLNCPILAQTQEYTEAFTKILFHPKLHEHLVRKRTVYRGIVLEDKKLIDNYKEGARIITTTFLSTSTSREVANSFSTATGNGTTAHCTYEIDNTTRHTALDITNLSAYPHEEEILILRYVPFTIKSVERTDDDREMKICFVECQEEYNVEENHF